MITYGGPLSDVFDGRAADALTGLLRITRPGQPVLASVMSLLGTWRHFLPSVVAGADVFGEDVNDRVLVSGDLRVTGGARAVPRRPGRRPRRRRRRGAADDQRQQLGVARPPDTVAALEADPDRWTRFLTHEAAACREPGALDGGTHILFAARSPTPPSGGIG